MPVGNAGDHPLAFETAPPQARHLGVETGLIYEYEAADLLGVGCKPVLTFAPNRPGHLYIRTLLLAGVCGFF